MLAGTSYKCPAGGSYNSAGTSYKHLAAASYKSKRWVVVFWLHRPLTDFKSGVGVWIASVAVSLEGWVECGG